jgi:hypothetical protein
VRTAHVGYLLLVKNAPLQLTLATLLCLTVNSVRALPSSQVDVSDVAVPDRPRRAAAAVSPAGCPCTWNCCSLLQPVRHVHLVRGHAVYAVCHTVPHILPLTVWHIANPVRSILRRILLRP